MLAILEPRDNQCLFLMEMFVLSYANVLRLYPKLCLQVGSASWPRTDLTNQYVILRYCSPNLCKWNYLYGGLPFFKIQVNHFMGPGDTIWCQDYPKMHLMGEGPGAILNFKTFLSFINRLLVIYNIQLKTKRGVLFLPPSDAYVRSFLYLLYTLIKLYYTKALSDQASSLAPDWILLLRGTRIPVYSCDSTTTFQTLSANSV